MLRTMRPAVLVVSTSLAAGAAIAASNNDLGSEARWAWLAVAVLATACSAALQFGRRARRPGDGTVPGGHVAGPGAVVGDDAAALGTDRAVPSQLPPSIADFTGREAEFERIKEVLDPAGPHRSEAVVISTITGQGGIGKTALAVQTAHRLSDWYPDGRLYVNLRGVGGNEVAVGDALADFLRAFGIGDELIPESLERREQLYRTLLATKRVVIVLDNAGSEDQVRPLLPGGSHCAVIVTSRSSLSTLSSSTWIHLDVLDPAQARELLAKIVGRSRVEAEPAVADEIVSLCGYLPLAVRIAGAKLQAKQHWLLGDLAVELRDEHQRLSALRSGDLEVRASFSIGYGEQDALHKRAFRMLGLLRMTDFSSWVLAALLDTGAKQAAGLLEDLCDAHLMESGGRLATGVRRYRFHDLVRDYARELARDEETAETRLAALQRVLGCYLALAERADNMLEPGLRNLDPGDAPRWPTGDPALLAAEIGDDPHLWFVAERANLVIAVEQASEARLWALTWELAGVFAAFFAVRVYWGEWEHTHDLALRAARLNGDRRGEAFIQRSYGRLLRYQGRWAEARRSYDWALQTFRDLQERTWEGVTLRNLGDLESDQGNLAAAEAMFQQAVDTFRDLGDEQWEAATLRSLGEIWRREGRFDEAITCYERCLRIFDAGDQGWWLATTMTKLGDVYFDTGRLPEAREMLVRSLTRFRALDDRRWTGISLVSLARVELELRQPSVAQKALVEAEGIFDAAGDKIWKAKALQARGQVYQAMGKKKLAAECRRAARQTDPDLDQH
jgi:tetratricopeptide (TPR) repeat protein